MSNIKERLKALSDSWRTPDWLFKQLDEEFNFDIDLCATKENSKCERYCSDYLKGEVSYTFDDSTKGKEIIWDLVENAFMNPPYSNPKPFIEKAWEDSKHCKIVCLVKCDTSTRWWATFWDYGVEDCPICWDDIRSEVHRTCCRGGLYYRGSKPGCEVRFFPKRIQFDPPQELIDSKDVWRNDKGKWEYYNIERGYETISGPTFPSALIIMDRRKV